MMAVLRRYQLTAFDIIGVWRTFVMDWFEQSRLLIVPIMPRLVLRYFLEAGFADRAGFHDLSW
jgi:hypothetical protein